MKCRIISNGSGGGTSIVLAEGIPGGIPLIPYSSGAVDGSGPGLLICSVCCCGCVCVCVGIDIGVGIAVGIGHGVGIGILWVRSCYAGGTNGSGKKVRFHEVDEYRFVQVDS